MADILAPAVALPRPFDASARILVYGLLGFVAVLVAETLVTMLEGEIFRSSTPSTRWPR